MIRTIISAEEAFERLKQGNQEYIEQEFNPNDISPEIRLHTFENGQNPFAMVIACSDSRVIPEALFSVGIGEIFTVRIAGNVVGEHELGCVEYAAHHLGVPLVVVLGHTDCGAVHAAIHGEVSGYVGAITKKIRKACGEEKNPSYASARNAIYNAEKIREVFKDQITVKAAIYHTHHGLVEWVE